MMRDKRETFDHGDWNVIDQRSGFKKKASEVSRQWDGLLVSRGEFEHRHPQDFVKGRRDRQNVAAPRPEAADKFVSDVIDPEAPTFVTFIISQAGECIISQANELLVSQ